MNKKRELILRIEEAEQATISALNEIIQAYDLPFFLFEPIIDKAHRQLIDGKKNELIAAKRRENEVGDRKDQGEIVEGGCEE